MNALFYLQGCNICERASMGVLRNNIVLPPGEKISFISIYSRDPRLKFVAEWYQSSRPENWSMPLLLLEQKMVGKFLGRTEIINTNRMVLRGLFTQDHLWMLIDEYKHNH